MDKLADIFEGKIYYEILFETDLEKKSLLVINELFNDKLDKGGQPYIEHLLYVANKLEGDAKIVGYLHDTLEDTNVTAIDLINLGFPERIVYSVQIVTKREGELYQDFITRILSSNDINAIMVKKTDMEHNMLESRLNSIKDETIKKRLIKKYQEPYKRINEYLEKREK